jgi:hypothetical protein
MRQEKGIGSLNILLSVVTMIFAIGLVVMVFALMGSSLMAQTTDPTSIQTINQTTQAIATVPTWFAIIITIAVMVVLILLVVIIISAIRGVTAVGGYGETA